MFTILKPTIGQRLIAVMGMHPVGDPRWWLKSMKTTFTYLRAVSKEVLKVDSI
jgi:hypothetical protein